MGFWGVDTMCYDDVKPSVQLNPCDVRMRERDNRVDVRYRRAVALRIPPRETESRHLPFFAHIK